MKKILAVLCSAVLTVAMTVTAFAQPSVVASGVVTVSTKRLMQMVIQLVKLKLIQLNQDLIT